MENNHAASSIFKHDRTPLVMGSKFTSYELSIKNCLAIGLTLAQRNSMFYGVRPHFERPEELDALIIEFLASHHNIAV